MTASIDLAGRRFGRLVATSLAPPRREPSGRVVRMWYCVCDCGTQRICSGDHLRQGSTKSCGCYNREVAASRRTKHGGARRPEYRIWAGIRTRCRNPNASGYENYGARGIKVCDRWEDFEAFLADMGARPSPEHSIERRDNHADYSPENCYWADRMTQNNNSRSNVPITIDGVTRNVSQWNRVYGVVHVRLARERLARGWQPYLAFTTPPTQP